MEDEHDEDDWSEDEPEDDLTRIAAALMIEKGNRDGAERQMRRDHGMSTAEAQEVMDDALALLLGNAPREIRQSFEAVVSWHRWNAMYQNAAKKGKGGNVEVMALAQKQMDNLMSRVH